MTKEFYFDWHVDLRSKPADLWSFAADTNRFNRDTGLPPITEINDAKDTRPGARRLRFYIYGQKIEWDEEPFEWIFPFRFGVARYYVTGPVGEMRTRTEFTQNEKGGTHLRYQVWAKPRNLLGYIAIPIQIGFLSARKFISAFKNYDTIVQLGGSHYDIKGSARFTNGGRARLQNAKQTIVVTPDDEVAYNHIVHLLESADDLALQKLRPYQLADFWKLPRRPVLELFLRATRAGILDFRWEMICPSCRGVTESHASLSEVHHASHCNTCNMDFNVNFERQVEVIFRPNPAVRIIPEELLYCVAGPQSGAQLLVKESLSAEQTNTLNTLLEPGSYNLRASGAEHSLPILVSNDGASKAEIELSQAGWGASTLTLSTSPSLKIINGTKFPQLIILEREAWRDDAATAADVTSLQLFRNLFSREALRTNEGISIGRVTLMFTDLRDSTRLYRQVGDAPAFGRVRQHFEVLEQAIAEEGGAVVKTIGDAVMAIFRQPVMAFNAIEKANASISKMEGLPTLSIKVGIHTGTCITVTLNERLDYFGSTVNIAARLPGLANGGEIVFSNDVFNDPEVQQLLKDKGMSAEMFRSAVKGFDETFDLWRMKLLD